MIVLLVLTLFFLHGLAVVLCTWHAMLVSYIFLVATPLLAALAVFRRSWQQHFAHSPPWHWLVVSLLGWAGGMALSARQDMFMGNVSADPGDSMLLYILYGVPIAFVLSRTAERDKSRLVRLIDALLAMTLGYLYFVLTFSLAGLHGSASRDQIRLLIYMFDFENLFLVAGAFIRYKAACTFDERHFFGVLSIFLGVYLVSAFYNNHFLVVDPDLSVGTPYDLILDVPFAVLMISCWRQPRTPKDWNAPSAQLVRYVASGSPLLMALAVLLVAILVLQDHFYLGIAGILIGLLAYGLRNTFTQVRHIATEDELRHERTALEGLVWVDALTGIANRRAFDRTLEQELKRGRRAQRPLTLLMIDIDYFKYLNDRHGHSYGDECLQKVANCLSKQLTRPADFVARYGGEEFTMILPDTSIDAAKQIAERVREAIIQLQRPNEDSPLGMLTVSIGAVQVSGTDEYLASHWMESADRALYAAKHAGRNRVYAEPQDNNQTSLTDLGTRLQRLD